MKTKKELESELSEARRKLHEFNQDVQSLKLQVSVIRRKELEVINRLMTGDFKPDHLGKFFRVDKGGSGCGVANGISGVSVAKPSWEPIAYAGKIWSNDAPVYIRGVDGIVYGLCEGYEIEEISKEQFINDLVKEHLPKD